MNKPLVSIILPTYNHESYVVETLDSVLAQDYPNKELLIINDGSQDATHERIEEWLSRHQSEIHIEYRTRENKGISATLNDLLSMTHGQYIAGASSDDILLDQSISVRMDYLLSNPAKKAVFCDFHVIDENGTKIHESGLTQLYKGRKEMFYDDTSLKREFLYRFCVAGPVLMFDRSVFDLIGRYDESLMVEDWDMYLRLAAHKVLGFIDQPLVAYRWHAMCTNRSKRDKVKLYRYEQAVLERNLPYFEGEDLDYIHRRLRKAKRKALKYAAIHKMKKLVAC